MRRQGGGRCTEPAAEDCYSSYKEGATIIATALGKFVEASSKIEVTKMEASKDIALKMIELDDRNAERQLQIAQLFVGAMREGNGSCPSTS